MARQDISLGYFHPSKCRQPKWTGLADHNLRRSIARPATLIIDRRGIITYTYIGSNQFDLAEQEEILDHLDSLTP